MTTQQQWHGMLFLGIGAILAWQRGWPVEPGFGLLGLIAAAAVIIGGGGVLKRGIGSWAGPVGGLMWVAVLVIGCVWSIDAAVPFAVHWDADGVLRCALSGPVQEWQFGTWGLAVAVAGFWGWYVGTAAAVSGRDWRRSLAALAGLLVATAALGALVTGLVAFGVCGALSEWEAALRRGVFVWLGLSGVWPLAVLAAGWRSWRSWRRWWYLTGGCVLIGVAVWGVAEGYYRWRAGQLPVVAPEPVLNEAETAALAAFDRVAAALAAETLTAAEEQAALVAIEAWLQYDSWRIPTAPGTPETLSYLIAVRRAALVLQRQVRRCRERDDLAGTLFYLELGWRPAAVWPGDDTLIGQLIRLTVDQIAAEDAVRLGPDGPEYAAVYQEWLQRSMTRSYDRISDARFVSAWLAWARQWRLLGEQPTTGPTVTGVWLNPVMLHVAIATYHEAFEGQEAHDAARRRLAPGVGVWPLEMPKGAGTVWSHASRAVLSRVALWRTALALKLFRSQTGRYPEDLQELTPAILPVLPLDPVTGWPLEYEKDGDAFRLRAAYSSKELESGGIDDERM